MIFATDMYPFSPFSQTRYQNFCKIHTHNFFEISVVLTGEIINCIEKREYRQKAGDAFFLRPGESHSLKPSADSPENVVYSHQDFYVNEDTFRALCDILSPELYANILNSPEAVHITLDQQHFNLIAEKISLNNYLFNNNFYNHCQTVTKSMIFLLLDAYQQKEVDQKNPLPAWLKTFICEIQSSENLTKPVNELYKLSNYSHGYLCVLFKKYMGTTLERYVINLKMKYATKLLQDSTLSIAQISGLCGYYNQCNFVKQFKKEFQCTPQKWRSFHRKDL